MTGSDDDAARILAKQALVEIKSLERLAALSGSDATEAQELTICFFIRSYSVEKINGIIGQVMKDVPK